MQARTLARQVEMHCDRLESRTAGLPFGASRHSLRIRFCRSSLKITISCVALNMSQEVSACTMVSQPVQTCLDRLCTGC